MDPLSSLQVAVPVGHEGRISQLLQAEPKNYIFLLPLEDAACYTQGQTHEVGKQPQPASVFGPEQTGAPGVE